MFRGTMRPDRQVRRGGNMKRALGWALVSLGFAGAVMAMTALPGGATLPVELTNTPLARGSNTSVGTIPLMVGSDVAMAQITVNPGGSSGWHSHPGGAIIVVQHGSLKVYRSVGDQCHTRTYSRRSGVRRATWRSGSSHQHRHGPRMSCSSPSRVCPRARPRGPTSRTQVRVQVLTTRPSLEDIGEFDMHENWDAEPSPRNA